MSFFQKLLESLRNLFVCLLLLGVSFFCNYKQVDIIVYDVKSSDSQVTDLILKNNIKYIERVPHFGSFALDIKESDTAEGKTFEYKELKKEYSEKLEIKFGSVFSGKGIIWRYLRYIIGFIIPLSILVVFTLKPWIEN